MSMQPLEIEIFNACDSLFENISKTRLPNFLEVFMKAH